MLINSVRVAEAPSRCVATAGSRRLAGFGLGAVVRVRGQADLAAEAGRMSGVRRGGGNARLGYLPGLADSVRPGQLAGSPVQARTLRSSVVTKSTVQISNYQHNTIQVTRLVPAGPGGVGPHPVREPGPA